MASFKFKSKSHAQIHLNPGESVATAIIIADRPEDGGTSIYTGRVIRRANEPEFTCVQNAIKEVQELTGHIVAKISLLAGNHSEAIGKLTSLAQVDAVMQRYAAKVIGTATVRTQVIHDGASTLN
jgi:hypothetical protein